MLEDGIVRHDILIMPIPHAKASGDHSKRREAKALIQMPCVDVRAHDSIELHDPEALLPRTLHRIKHKALSDMKAAEGPGHGKAAVADMAASANVVRMEDIEPGDHPIHDSDRAPRLRGEEGTSG